MYFLVRHGQKTVYKIRKESMKESPDYSRVDDAFFDIEIAPGMAEAVRKYIEENGLPEPLKPMTHSEPVVKQPVSETEIEW